MNHFKEKSFIYNEEVFQNDPPLYLDGYWQSEKYFLDISKHLYSEFVLKQPLDKTNQEMMNQINDSKSNAVSLHIRRGDYVKNPKTALYHGICSLDYYRSAADYLAARLEAPHFYVFSDDLEWVSNNLELPYLMTLVDVNGPDRGASDMTLMMACRHNVIANSTFSWWGAWLNQHVGKIVIAPERWFIEASLDTRDLIPASWVRL
jgi:hypothetical protein